MAGLSPSPKAKRRVLPLAIRRKIVDLEAEHPPNFEEIANVCGALFALEALGAGGRLGALRLEDYAPRRSRHPGMLQRVLFAYTEAA